MDCDRLRFVAEAPEANKTRKTFGLVFRRAASCRGVNLRLLSADMAAPFFSKISIVLGLLLYRDAPCRGVNPFKSTARTDAPLSINSCTMCGLLARAALCSGVFPNRSTAEIEAPCSRRMLNNQFNEYLR